MNTNRWTDFTLTGTAQLYSPDAETSPSPHRSPQMSRSIWTRICPPPSRDETGPGPADFAAGTETRPCSQWVALPKEALPDPAPCTWHITASPPHRRLGLKTQAGSCWLKIHLSVYYDLCMFHWARNEKERRTASLAHIVCVCVWGHCTYACLCTLCVYVCVASWQVGDS